MMKKSIILSIGLIAGLLFTSSSCKSNDPEPTPSTKGTLKLEFNLYNGANTMGWNEVVAIDNVNEYRMEFMKFYLSNIYAVKTSGEEVKLADVVLANAAETDGMTFLFDLEKGSYDKIKFGFGLDSLLNASDPVQFSPEEPLSAAQAMYWSWATKYRFVRIDAKANENGTIGSPDDLLIAYHPGADEFYSVGEFVNPFTITVGNTTTFSMKLDMAAVFDGPGGVINMPTEPQTHTEPSDYQIAVKFIANWIAAFSVM